MIRRALRSSRRELDAEALVRAMVFNRLCAPDSKLGCLEWLDTVAIPGMPALVQHDHLLRTMDALIDQVDAVETKVAELLRPTLDQEMSVVFYDLTTVHIHGEAKLPDDLRAHGMHKEAGGIIRQFVLVQLADGLPLMHAVHAGNASETKTLRSMLCTVLKRFPVERVVLAADRGLLSLEKVAEVATLATETSRKLQFILAVPARRYIELGGTIEALQFKNGIAEGRFADQRLVVAHDPKRVRTRGIVRRQARAADQRRGRHRRTGCRVYKSLADIERGFRMLKSDLQIAPVHHRLPDRIRAHALSASGRWCFTASCACV